MKKILIFLFASVLFAQPKFENGYVVFTIYAPDAKKVAVAGDFNGWSKNDFLTKDEKGFWSGKFKIKPGLYQYKFIVDDKWMTDPENPVKVENFTGPIITLSLFCLTIGKFCFNQFQMLNQILTMFIQRRTKFILT
jgi:hypothetical protein